MRSAIGTTWRRVENVSGPAALIVAMLALIAATAGIANAVSHNAQTAKSKKAKTPSTKPKPYGLLLLNKKKQFPAKAIPKVRKARDADRLGGTPAAQLVDGCAADSVDLGTYCMMSVPFPLNAEDEGKSNYFFATKKCAELGGWLPSAGQLIGAVERVRLASTIDDSRVESSIDEDPTDGLKDRREMSATLVTTAAGSSASGSQGVTPGSRGDPRTQEGDPIPLPANPQPEDLQYITVYDNKNLGGFAGSKPVSQPERFRCAFAKSQARDQRQLRE
jgi:hypothetical protein